MLQNYLKIGYRNLLKHKGYSFINIGGLAIGLAVTMLIGLWIYDEFSYDTHNPGYDRIARVMQQGTFDGKRLTIDAVSMPLAPELKELYGSDFDLLVMAAWPGEHILNTGEHTLIKTGNYMDVGAPDLLGLVFVAGGNVGLKDLHSILIAASTAKALFGNEDALGKAIKLDNRFDVTVTGIYQDIPHTSEFWNLKFIAPWELYVTSESWIKQNHDEQDWRSNSFQLFVMISSHSSFEVINSRIAKIARPHVPDKINGVDNIIFLHPMKEWHLQSNWENGIQRGGLLMYIRMFGLIGVFVLFLATINFMNLTTARSEKRAKEVAIRKTMGSIRCQLAGQFLSESFLMTVIAFVIAVGFVFVSLPYFNVLTDKQMKLPLEPWSWILVTGFILATTLIAGSYPALHLSSFSPVKILKGSYRSGKRASAPRNTLVVVQFTISVALIIGTIIVYEQLDYAKSRPRGYRLDGIITISKRSRELQGKHNLLRDELLKSGGAETVAESSAPLTAVWTRGGGFSWPGKNPNFNTDFDIFRVTPDFGKTINWDVIRGRDFSRNMTSDSSSLIVNEAAAGYMGLDDPVGTVVRWGDDDFTIIGVVRNILSDSPYNSVRQGIYILTSEASQIVIRLASKQSTSASLAQVESVFNKLAPNDPFDYKFVDEEYGRKFTVENRIGKLVGIFSVLAIFISSLGLFGLASFVASQRSREISIRKVLGASVIQLWMMLSRGFLVPVVISCILAIPISYTLLSDWLSGYDYRIEISAWVFIISTGVAVIITLIVVSYQSLKTALANPVESLKGL